MEIDSVSTEVKEPEVSVAVLPVEPKKKRSKVTLTATIDKNYLEFSRLFGEFSVKIDNLCAKTVELEERTNCICNHLQEMGKLERVNLKIIEIQTPET